MFFTFETTMELIRVATDADILEHQILIFYLGADIDKIDTRLGPLRHCSIITTASIHRDIWE